MDWREFGRLIRHLRFELSESEMRKITQEDLDQRCGFPIGTVGRIERGDMRRLSHEHLVALANAFRLTHLERREFFLAANGVPTEQIYGYPDAPPAAEELQMVLKGVYDVPYPALITDSYSDIVYAHRALLSLFHVTPQVLEDARAYKVMPNLMYYIFHPSYHFESLFPDPGQWFQLAVANVQFFRRITLRYRTRRYWDYLMYRLQKDDPRLWSNFRIFWMQAEMRREWDGNTYRQYHLQHPVLGSLRFLSTVSEENTARGPLYIVVYLPLDRDTEQAFHRLSEISPVTTAERWVSIAAWPEEAKDRFIEPDFKRPRRRRI